MLPSSTEGRHPSIGRVMEFLWETSAGAISDLVLSSRGLKGSYQELTETAGINEELDWRT